MLDTEDIDNNYLIISVIVLDCKSIFASFLV